MLFRSRDNFIIDHSWDTLALTPDNNLTLNELLEQTKRRIGAKKFFNWNVFKHNCNLFTKELLITLGIYNQTLRKFICRYRIVNKFACPDDFMVHVFNCLQMMINIGEHYLFDTLWF